MRHASDGDSTSDGKRHDNLRLDRLVWNADASGHFTA